MLSLSFSQNILICFFGMVFYFALGGNRIANTFEPPVIPIEGVTFNAHTATKLSLGSMAIINGFVYLADTIFGIIDLKNSE